MTIDEIESEALRLHPSDRARLAERLLDSLEALSDQENARLWADEAERRDGAWDAKAMPAAPRRRCSVTPAPGWDDRVSRPRLDGAEG